MYCPYQPQTNSLTNVDLFYMSQITQISINIHPDASYLSFLIARKKAHNHFHINYIS